MRLPSFERGGDPDATSGAILLPPHPDFGGTRFHPLIDTLFHRLPLGTVRFDYRDANPSQARSAAEHALTFIGDLPTLVVGYSFGAGIAASVVTPQVAAWVLIAPPLAQIHAGEAPVAARQPQPKLVLLADVDPYSPAERVREVTAAWPNVQTRQLAGTDHFFAGHEGAVLTAVTDWLCDHPPKNRYTGEPA